jgi:MSHA biogenesis protein MshQ
LKEHGSRKNSGAWSRFVLQSVALLFFIFPIRCLAIIPFGFWSTCNNLTSQWTPQWSSLQVYLRLDEATAGTAPGGKDYQDYSGNGNHATKSGATMNQAGKLNKSVMLTGTSSNKVTVPVPAIDTASGHSVTVMFWMNWNGVESTAGTSYTVPFGFNDLSLAFQSTSHVFGFCTSNDDVYGFANSAVPSNTWVHIAAVFVNGTLTTNKLYINGVSQTLSQVRGTPAAAAVYKTVTTSAFIGNIGASGTFSFQGNIDELAIFNGALTATEIGMIYNFQKDARLSCP